ncbi:MAG: zinc ribbon domain-containing protein [Planctomycetaceae bacterium]|nr:zinc ribbon domain-containing protein [Planctomycetaceae bacterium]
MAQVLDSSAALEEAAPIVDSSPCNCCGAPVEKNDRFCVHCGSEQLVEVAIAETPALHRHFRCKSCGAEVAVDPDQRSYTCAFCDSNYVVELTPDQTGRQKPEFVIGFAVTREDAMERFRQWLGQGNWFRPGNLKSAEIEGKMTGVYLPFWSFSMFAESCWNASVGEHWYRTETYTTRENGKTVTKTRRVQETEWWPLAGRHHQYYSFYLVSGSKSLNQAWANQIKPFHLAALKRYEPRYLAGWTNEEYTVDREEAETLCRDEFTRQEKQNVAAFLPGDTHRNLQVSTQFSNVHSDLILLPVYLLNYRHCGKLYQFLLNGQTGKPVGKKPVSWAKVGAVVLGVVAAIAVIAILAAL